MRVLYIQATLVPPPTDLQRDMFFLLSEKLEGDVLQPVWFDKPEQIEAVFGPGSFPVYTAGRSRYHWFLAERYHGVWQKLAIFWFYLSKGMQLHRERTFDCIVAYSHMTTGLCAGLLKLLSGSKLIIEIVTEPESIYLTAHSTPTFLDRIMHIYSDACLHLTTFLSDRLHLLYPWQMAKYSKFHRIRSSVFPDFVPVSSVPRHSANQDSELYILLVGAPWYRKGVDLLIEAFQRLSANFPNAKLKILGHFPDRAVLDALIAGSPQIEILKARPHSEVLPIMSAATIMALPSRNEGVPRVLVEAMAAGIPIVASDVAGIPYIITNGENGYVVPTGDSHLLEQRLRELLSDPEKRRRMGDKSYIRAHSEFDEKSYVRNFAKMVESAVNGQEMVAVTSGQQVTNGEQ